jgi:hypothetical protein
LKKIGKKSETGFINSKEISILYEGEESLREDLLRENVKDGPFPQCTTGGKVVIPLLRLFLSSLQFPLQPASTSIIHSISLGDGTQKKAIHGSLRFLLHFPEPLSFSKAFVFLALDYFKL